MRGVKCINMCEAEIIEYLNIASNLISEAHSENPESDVFEQAGILTGKEIVLSYIDHRELGVAIEHLLYIVHESEVSYPQSKLVALHEIAKKLKVEYNYVLPNT